MSSLFTMKARTTLYIFFSLIVHCLHAQNATTEKPEESATFAISRDILSNPNFGLQKLPVTTTSPVKVTTEKTCPPNKRWDTGRTASFVECLCKVEGREQQPCVLRFSNLLGMYERMVVPAILPRITATDLGFLFLWTNHGFQCHPFMGIGGLSIACYHEIGSFPISRDCVRRIPVPVTTPAPRRHPINPPRLPSPLTIRHTPLQTTASPSGMVASLLHDSDDPHADHDHDMHDHHGIDAEHLRMDTIKVVSGVVGGVLAGIFITAVIFIVCWLCKRRRQQPTSSPPRPKMSVRKQESAVYNEVEEGSDSGLVNAAYLSSHAPDVISILGSKGRTEEHSYNTLNNTHGAVSSLGSPLAHLGRPPSIESNQYCTINDNDTLSKRASRNSVYNKLREDGKSVVCDHVYNRAQFRIQDGGNQDGYDEVTPKQNNYDNPQKPIMKKYPSTGSIKKRVYFTLEPVESLKKDHEDF